MKNSITNSCRMRGLAIVLCLFTQVSLLSSFSVLGAELLGSFPVHSELRFVSFEGNDDSVLVGTTTGIHEMALDETFSYRGEMHADRAAALDSTEVLGIPYQVIGTEDGFVFFQSTTLIYADKLNEGIRDLFVADPPIRYLAATGHQIRIRNVLVSYDVILEKESMEGFTAATFSSGGTLAAAGMTDGTVEVWNGESGVSMAMLSLSGLGFPGDSQPSALAFSEDDSVLVIGSDNGHVQALNTMDWSTVWEMNLNEAIRQIKLDGASSRCFLLDAGGNIQSSNLENGDTLHTWSPDEGRFFHFDLDKEGDRLMAANDLQQVQLWHASSGQEIAQYDAQHATTRVDPRSDVLDLSRDNKKVAIKGANNYVQIWDLDSMQMDIEFRAEELRTPGLSAKLSNNGTIGFFRPTDSTWPAGGDHRPSRDHHTIADATTGEALLEAELLERTPGDPQPFTFTDLAPEGDRVLVFGEDTLYEVSLENPERAEWKIISQESDNYRLSEANYTPDGQYIYIPAFFSNGGRVNAWVNTSSRKVTHTTRYGGFRLRHVVAPNTSIMVVGPLLEDEPGFPLAIWDLENETSRQLELQQSLNIESITPVGFLPGESNLFTAIIKLHDHNRYGRGVIDLANGTLLSYVAHSDLGRPNTRSGESSDGRFLMRNRHLWDLEHGVMLDSFSADPYGDTPVTFLHNSRHFLRARENRVELYRIPEPFELPALQYTHDRSTETMSFQWEMPDRDTVVLQKATSIRSGGQWRTVAPGSTLQFHVDARGGRAGFFRLHFTEE